MVLQSESYPGLQAVANSPDAPTLATSAAMALRILWDRLYQVSTLAKGPTLGTLSADTKPTGLGQKDAGFRFFATDFNREYQWSGSAWADAPSAATRFLVGFFPQAQQPEPGIGWSRCSGASVFRSTSVGLTIYYNTPVIPDLTGMRAWIRL